MAEHSNFRGKDVYPSHSEMLETRQFHLKRNIIDRPFEDVEQYLEIHFNLLREDFLASVRRGLDDYLAGRKNQCLNVYENVTIFASKECGYKQMKIKLDPNSKISNLEDSNKLLNGSLLIFSRDNFQTSFLAKVIHRDKADFKKNIISIEFVERNQNLRNLTMVESRSFFEPYFHVMRALQKIKRDEFPMERYIIHLKTEIRMPRYMLEKLPRSLFHLVDESEFNESQMKAYRDALFHELAMIQGPPGTGKTSLGLKIAETLLKNGKLWYSRSPILVISHKNHVLDKFLEGLIRITQKVVRVGGQSKSKILDKYNLNKLVDHAGNIKNCPYCRSLDYPLCRKQKSNLEILQEALVVGMTTTAAARMRKTLDSLGSPIVIVEEAAEVLEAHVIAALSSKCQHLILLGDNLQFQPKTFDEEIGQKYHLGVSLFDRLAKNGINYNVLYIQHRMRPQISNILQKTAYPFLEDHPSVFNKQPILGVDHGLFFLNHNHPEETDGTSKKNNYEAKFVVAFAKYLIQNGNRSSEVTILTTYAGQVKEIKREIRLLHDRKWLDDVRVSTLDAFQGQESEIIILSLVRSRKIGFVANENRISVAMSRTKNGFYMIGNMTLLSENSEVWHTIHQCLLADGVIGPYLTLRCQQHPEAVTDVASAEDFQKVPCGGCLKPCTEGAFPCGHKCHLSCHILQHDEYSLYSPCSEICGKTICNVHESALCSKRCFEPCEECTVETLKKFECGHEAVVECFVPMCPHCSSDDLDDLEYLGFSE